MFVYFETERFEVYHETNHHNVIDLILTGKKINVGSNHISTPNTKNIQNFQNWNMLKIFSWHFKTFSLKLNVGRSFGSSSYLAFKGQTKQNSNFLRILL